MNYGIATDTGGGIGGGISGVMANTQVTFYVGVDDPGILDKIEAAAARRWSGDGIPAWSRSPIR
jgi:hypothetical protein